MRQTGVEPGQAWVHLVTIDGDVLHLKTAGQVRRQTVHAPLPRKSAEQDQHGDDMHRGHAFSRGTSLTATSHTPVTHHRACHTTQLFKCAQPQIDAYLRAVGMAAD